MKCQILFCRKNKKNIINLSSAESAHCMVSVKVMFDGLVQINSLTLCMLNKIFSRLHFEIFFSYFFQRTRFDIICRLFRSIFTTCMKCQSLFSAESKKNKSPVCCLLSLHRELYTLKMSLIV